MRKRILWIQTGGTFSCAGTKCGLAPQSSEEQAGKILALMPQVCEKYDIVPMTLMNIDSSDMTISDQKRIADTVNDSIGKYDGHYGIYRRRFIGHDGKSARAGRAYRFAASVL